MGTTAACMFAAQLPLLVQSFSPRAFNSSVPLVVFFRWQNSLLEPLPSNFLHKIRGGQLAICFLVIALQLQPELLWFTYFFCFKRHSSFPEPSSLTGSSDTRAELKP